MGRKCKARQVHREEVKPVDKVDLALAIAALSAILQAITVWQNRDRE
ncbi:hypothetical protein SEA_ECLIPTUS_42 [Gordonia phage Ecliptus]|nr:hypothetical protein SEA_ECLIPTUS_42 [Gordonia phage Ecliptus]